MKWTPYSSLPYAGMLLACMLLANAHAQSDPIVFETRPPGQDGGGLTILGNFHAHTFRLHERTAISALGIDNFGIATAGAAGETVFAALYQVDTPDTVPDVVGESGLLGATLLEIPSAETSVTGALSLTVDPGIYAIVIGTGRHGATAGSLQARVGKTGTENDPDTWRLPYSLNRETGTRTLLNSTPRYFIQGQVLPPVEPPPTAFRMETALPTAWWTRGSNPINEDWWYGTRFEVSHPTQIERVGSWMHMGSGQVFAAIIELTGPDAVPLPVGHPSFADSVAGTALVDVSDDARLYTAQFEDTVLSPGHYAIAFGSGMFGASGTAGSMMVEDQIVMPGQLRWIGLGGYWSDAGNNTRMIVVEGFMPEFSELSVAPDPADFGSVPIDETGAETFTITNLRDDADLQMDGIDVDGPGFDLHPDGSNCATATIGPGDDCQFTVLFNPAETGESTGSLQVISDGEPSPLVIDLTGNGTGPAIDLDPDILDFGIHQGDTESAILSVGNTGEADLHWNVMISETPLGTETRNFQEIHEGFESVSQLPASGWAMINNSDPLGTTNWFQGGAVTFPAHQGPDTSYITAAYHNTQGADGTISNWLLTPELNLSNGVQLRFWTRVPENSCCPDRLEVRLSTAGASSDVGDPALSVGDFDQRLLAINDDLIQGGYPEQWNEFIVTVPAQGTDASGRLAFRYFVTEAGPQASNSNWLGIDTVSITQWDGGAVCTGPAEIPWLSVFPDTGTTPPDGSSEIDVGIDTAGLAEGEYSAQLCVSSNDSNNPLAAVPINLTVLPPRTPELVFDPATLDFSDVNIGDTGGPRTVTLSNIGNAGASGLSLALSGDFDLHFNDCGNALPADGDCEIGIVFAPTEEGAAAGLLEAAADGGLSAALVLSGNGVDAPAPALEYGPDSFEFEVLQGGIDGDVLGLSNTGHADLEWNLFEPGAGSGETLILLEEDFEGGFPPSEWSTADDGSLPCPWRTSDDYGLDGWIGTARGAAVDSDDCFPDSVPLNSVDASLISPPLNLAHVNNARVEFDLAYRHLGLSRLRLDISTNGGGAWTTLRTWSSHFAFPNNPSLPVTVDLSEYEGESHVLLRWRYRAGWDWWAYVDNVVVSGDIPENCFDPAAHPWLDVDPISGIVEPAGTALIDLWVDTGELATGDYVAGLCILGNVPGNPLVVVPVGLSVTAPELTPDPALLDFGEVPVGTASTPQTATLHNAGSADATGLAFDVSGDAFEFDAADCGATLPAGQSCDIEVTFVPAGTGAVSTVLEISSGEGAVAGLQLSGTGIAATLELDPAAFSFELITGQHDTAILTVGNTGNIDLDWTIAAESECGTGSPVGWLSAAPSAGATIPGGATPVEVVADAQGLAAGLYQAVLCINSNALGAPQTGIPVSLSVTAPDLFFDPSVLDFGDVETGTGGWTLSATLHNQGDSAATGLDFLVPAGFSANTDDCGTALPAGENCEAAITFDPSEIGTIEGTLVVGSAKGVTAELVLSGRGVEFGTLGAAPDQLHFADVVVTRSRTLSFSVINTADPGANDLAVSTISLANGGPAFAINGIDCVAGTVLAPGESCGVEVSFTPAEVAPHDGTIRVTAEDGQQIIVTLSGTVLPDEILADRFETP